MRFTTSSLYICSLYNFLLGLLFLVPLTSIAEDSHTVVVDVSQEISDGKDGRAKHHFSFSPEQKILSSITADLKRISGDDSTYVKLRFHGVRDNKFAKKVYIPSSGKTVRWTINKKIVGQPFFLNAYNGQVVVDKVYLNYLHSDDYSGLNYSKSDDVNENHLSSSYVSPFYSNTYFGHAYFGNSHFGNSHFNNHHLSNSHYGNLHFVNRFPVKHIRSGGINQRRAVRRSSKGLDLKKRKFRKRRKFSSHNGSQHGLRNTDYIKNGRGISRHSVNYRRKNAHFSKSRSNRRHFNRRNNFGKRRSFNSSGHRR